MCMCVWFGVVPLKMDLHVLLLKKGTEKPEKEGQGAELEGSGCTFSVSCVSYSHAYPVS